jgi:hypothetical protein
LRRSFRRKSEQDRAGLAKLAHDDRALAKIEKVEAGRYISALILLPVALNLLARLSILQLPLHALIVFFNHAVFSRMRRPHHANKLYQQNELCSLYLCQLFLSFGNCKVQVVRFQFRVLTRCHWCNRHGIGHHCAAAFAFTAVIPGHAPHCRRAPVLRSAYLHVFAPTDR